MDFIDFDDNTILAKNKNLKEDVSIVQASNDEQTERLENLLAKMRAMARERKIDISSGIEIKNEEAELDDFNKWLADNFNNEFVNGDNQFSFRRIDILAIVIISGIAILTDFLIVKIPKKAIQSRYKDEGSSLTGFFRSLGTDKEGKIYKWSKVLEDKCKVPYDKSVDAGVAGLNPHYHRLMSLGHDPIMGLFFAFIDIKGGNFSGMDKNGTFFVEHITKGDTKSAWFEVIFTFFGHLLSDVTTKMGIPIPGWCLLQKIQLGHFGKKDRSFSDIARYMYNSGYDVRHFATMSTVPMVIELLTKIYFSLLCEVKSANPMLSEQEYIKIKNQIKEQRFLEIIYALVACGNLAKIVAFDGNPNAFNLPVWIGVIKEAINEYRIQNRDTKLYEKAIENRHDLNEKWNYIMEVSKKLNGEIKPI